MKFMKNLLMVGLLLVGQVSFASDVKIHLKSATAGMFITSGFFLIGHGFCDKNIAQGYFKAAVGASMIATGLKIVHTGAAVQQAALSQDQTHRNRSSSTLERLSHSHRV